MQAGKNMEKLDGDVVIFQYYTHVLDSISVLLESGLRAQSLTSRSEERQGRINDLFRADYWMCIILKQREVSLWKDNSKLLLGPSFRSGRPDSLCPTDAQNFIDPLSLVRQQRFE